MKKILVIVFVSLFAAAGLASAQEAVKLGYVDIRKAINECKSGKSAMAELDKSIKEKQVKVDEEKKKLEVIQADYEKKASDLSEKEKTAKQKDFQEKVQVYQKILAEAQKEVKDKEAAYTKKILGDINKAIEALAKAGKYTMIFGKTEGAILYSKDGIDLTAKVIKKLDSE